MFSTREQSFRSDQWPNSKAHEPRGKIFCFHHDLSMKSSTLHRSVDDRDAGQKRKHLRKLLERVVSKHPFNHQLNLFVGSSDAELSQHLQRHLAQKVENQRDYFFSCRLAVASLLFLPLYLKESGASDSLLLQGFSSGRLDSSECAIALLPNQTLIIKLKREAYQSLGLTGSKSPFDTKKQRTKEAATRAFLSSHYISIDLKQSEPKDSSEKSVRQQFRRRVECLLKIAEANMIAFGWDQTSNRCLSELSPILSFLSGKLKAFVDAELPAMASCVAATDCSCQRFSNDIQFNAWRRMRLPVLFDLSQPTAAPPERKRRKREPNSGKATEFPNKQDEKDLVSRRLLEMWKWIGLVTNRIDSFLTGDVRRGEEDTEEMQQEISTECLRSVDDSAEYVGNDSHSEKAVMDLRSIFLQMGLRTIGPSKKASTLDSDFIGFESNSLDEEGDDEEEKREERDVHSHEQSGKKRKMPSAHPNDTEYLKINSRDDPLQMLGSYCVDLPFDKFGSGFQMQIRGAIDCNRISHLISWIQEVLAEAKRWSLHSSRPAVLQFMYLYVSGFTDTAVSWDAKPHDFLFSGENEYALIFSTNFDASVDEETLSGSAGSAWCDSLSQGESYVLVSRSALDGFT